MNDENDTETVELSVLRDLARRTAARKTWLTAVCDLITDEADLLERRGALLAPRLDVAIDIGMTVLDMLADDAEDMRNEERTDMENDDDKTNIITTDDFFAQDGAPPEKLISERQPCRKYLAAEPGPTDEEIELELMRAEEVEQALEELAAERDAPQI